MKNYITIAALLAAGTAFANADFTKHDTTFNVDTTGKAYQNQTPATSNLYVDSGVAWGNGKEIQGLYVSETAGIQFNTGAGDGNGDVTVKYLYLDGSLTVTNTELKCVVGTVAWNKTGNNLNVAGENAWADIDADYGSLIDVSGMTSGALYLNTSGSLTVSTLAETVTVYATFDENNAERTLLSGDFSNWNGTVTVDGLATGYEVAKSADGLKIVASVPEPSAFGLLAGIGALALVASRRRRK